MIIMLGAMFKFVLVLFLPTVAKSDVSRISVVCPEVAVPGQSTAVLVSLHQREEINVTLRLVSDRSTASASSGLLAFNTVKIEGEGTIGVPVPSHTQGKVSLETFVNCDFDKLPCRPQVTCCLRLVGPVRDVIIRPKSKYYKPGETVEFWVLAVDHDLRVASDITASVYLIDPSYTKTAIWEQINLNQEMNKFSTPLSKKTTTGIWRIDVKIDDNVFSTSLNVSRSRGCEDPVTPELPIAEEHFVELRFSKEMRRRYKPGLPFVGKVEAVSSEKAVRVRVKVLDNTTPIYSQDIEMAGGVGSFFVPAVLSDSELIFLQAELVSVEGKEIDSHYVLAKEPIYKWNSSSSCYLLVEEFDETLKPGDTAHPTVVSSCPCDSHLHYIVTTEGHLTFWDNGAVPAYDLPSKMGIGKPSLCWFNITFLVEATMAPVSHLLVYYVTPEGEPISDVISFDVRLLQNQVTLQLKPKNFWTPGEALDIHVLTDHDSYTCLIGGRGGDVHYQAKSGGVELDFTEAGVGFHQWSSDRDIKSLESIKSKNHRTISSDIEFEQIWLWQCFNYSLELESRGHRVTAPSEPGKWTLMALSVSPTLGLRYSPQVTLQVFRQLDVDFKVPSTIRVGESLEVDIKIGNNLNTCVDVSALLTLTEGAHFHGSSQPFVAEKLRLGPHGATSLVVRVVASTAGSKNITVEVSAYHSDTCQSVATGSVVNHTHVGTIVRHRSITVHPEGLVKTRIESAYFCANEQMVVSTQEDFRYELVSAPRNREGVVFEVRAGKGVHVALSEQQDLSQKMYQIVIGDQDNTISWLGRGKHGYSVHLTSASTPGILSSDQSKTFWLSWDRGAISFGTGSAVHEKRILKWKMDKRMKIDFIGFATTWGQPAEFRIWNFNDEAGYSQVIHLDVPRSLLPGSETGILMVGGGLHLPYLTSRMGPDLTEFTSLTTVIAHISSLLNNNQSSEIMSVDQNKEDALQDIKVRLQDLMQYRRTDGSFSDHSKSSSLWSTTEVLNLLCRAQSVVSIDTTVLSTAKQWIQTRQLPDGSFKDTPSDIAPDNLTLIDETSRIVAVTASTLICLVNIGLETEVDSKVVKKARRFLENHVVLDKPLDSVALSSLAYSLVKSRSEKVFAIVERLRNASTNDEGEFGWPHQRENSDWLYEEGVEQKKQPVTSHLREFKASLYALMAYTELIDLKSAEPVARYLFYRSNLLDTHVELINMAVEAFLEFGRLALDENRWLTISLATSGMELTDTLELKASSPPQILNLPSLPTKVFIYATGGGCATVQGRINYATYTTSKSNSLLDLWAGVDEEVMPKRNSVQELEGKLPMLRLRTCFRWKARPVGIVRIEIHLFSGFELMDVSKTALMDYGFFEDHVWFAVSNVTTNCATCINFSARSEFIINSLRPALARAYPSGRPDLASELFFHAHSGSPLLGGSSDDDLITWFGTTSTEEMAKPDPMFTESCTCGEICYDSTSTHNPATLSHDDEKQAEETNDFTDIIVFSDLREDFSTTQAEFVKSDVRKEQHVSNFTHNLFASLSQRAFIRPTVSSLDQTTAVVDQKSVEIQNRSSPTNPPPDYETTTRLNSKDGHHDKMNQETIKTTATSSTSTLPFNSSTLRNVPLTQNLHLSIHKKVGPFFRIRTVDEAINTQLKPKKTNADDDKTVDPLFSQQPLNSAETAKGKSSNFLKDTRPLKG